MLYNGTHDITVTGFNRNLLESRKLFIKKSDFYVTRKAQSYIFITAFPNCTFLFGLLIKIYIVM